MDTIKYPIGSRIRFINDLVERANEDHPGCIFAKRGELGYIVNHNTIKHEGYLVTWDGWPTPFGASSTEFEVI